MRSPAGFPSNRIGWITDRATYLAMGKVPVRWVTPYFVLQVRPQPNPSDFSYRVGFTASRKVGGAVVRNRARRRLRELVRLNLPNLMQPGHDLVLIARPAAAVAPFTELAQTLTWAITRLQLNKQEDRKP